MTFKTFKTITLGKKPSLKGFQIGIWAKEMLLQVVYTKEKQELELVVISVAELGFKNGASRKDIYQRAQELGLELCPAEVGPQLRVQYKDQPKDEWLLIGMEPITGSDGNLSMFIVEHDDDGLWLSSDGGRPGYVWHGSRRWVFLRRKPLESKKLSTDLTLRVLELEKDMEKIKKIINI